MAICTCLTYSWISCSHSRYSPSCSQREAQPIFYTFPFSTLFSTTLDYWHKVLEIHPRSSSLLRVTALLAIHTHVFTDDLHSLPAPFSSSCSVFFCCRSQCRLQTSQSTRFPGVIFISLYLCRPRHHPSEGVKKSGIKNSSLELLYVMGCQGLADVDLILPPETIFCRYSTALNKSSHP